MDQCLCFHVCPNALYETADNVHKLFSFFFFENTIRFFPEISRYRIGFNYPTDLTRLFKNYKGVLDHPIQLFSPDQGPWTKIFDLVYATQVLFLLNDPKIENGNSLAQLYICAVLICV